jgi:hypothetical protein
MIFVKTRPDDLVLRDSRALPVEASAGLIGSLTRADDAAPPSCRRSQDESMIEPPRVRGPDRSVQARFRAAPRSSRPRVTMFEPRSSGSCDGIDAEGNVSDRLGLIIEKNATLGHTYAVSMIWIALAAGRAPPSAARPLRTILLLRQPPGRWTGA